MDWNNNKVYDLQIHTADDLTKISDQVSEKRSRWINLTQPTPEFNPQKAIDGFYSRMANCVKFILPERQSEVSATSRFTSDVREFNVFISDVNKALLAKEIHEVLRSMSDEFKERVVGVEILEGGVGIVVK